MVTSQQIIFNQLNKSCCITMVESVKEHSSTLICFTMEKKVWQHILKYL